MKNNWGINFSQVCYGCMYSVSAVKRTSFLMLQFHAKTYLGVRYVWLYLFGLLAEEDMSDGSKVPFLEFHGKAYVGFFLCMIKRAKLLMVQINSFRGLRAEQRNIIVYIETPSLTTSF